jgi:putative membrane-bound dehydrogenase-like protein
MKFLSHLAAIGLLFSPALSAQDKPIPAAEAPGKMTLPEGFKATLFAGEPHVVQPIAFTFDDRGRVWVVECLSYPKWSLDRTGNDRVTMFEDTDGDGKFDIRHVVYDKGSNLSGIELGFGGVWLCSTPNLVFLPCDFNADKPVPTGKPEIVLDGWNVKDTKHNIFNSLIWGPDGWLYGCNGIQSRSNVGRPGCAPKDRVEINCGVWRYHPTRKVFEAFAHGTTNPFGLDYDEYGEFFITNCVIKHLFHVIPGAHFDRMYGQDINPHSYALMPSIADYLHWAGGDWTTSRGNKPEHSDAGGGHAHSGAVVYLGDNFPAEYRNSLLTCNIHGNRLNRDLLKRHGSGYKAERAKDFLFANDSWFRGIALHVGPDGGLYVSDWCDTGECHNYDKADTSNGRIHKVVYGTPKAWKGDLSKQSNKELDQLVESRNEWLSRHARRILLERYHDPKQRPEVMTSVRRGVDRFQGSSPSVLRRAWLSGAIDPFGTADDLFSMALLQKDPDAEALAIRLVIDMMVDGSLKPEPRFTKFRGDFPLGRLAFATSIRRVPAADRGPWVQRLLQMLKPEDAADPNLPYLTWYAMEPLVTGGPLTTELYEQTQLPLVRTLIVRKATSIEPNYVSAILAGVAKSGSVDQRADMLQGMIDGLGGAREVAAPFGWAEAGPVFLRSSNAKIRERAMILAVTFGDQAAIASMMKTVPDPTADLGLRKTALSVLLRRGKPDLLPILKGLVSDKALRADALRGLAAFEDPEVPDLVLKTYPTLTDAEKEDAVQTLAARSAWALKLLDAVEAGTIPRRDVSVFVARQMQGLKDKRVADRLGTVWGQLQPASAQRAALTRKYKELLSDAAVAKADAVRGRQVYVKNCAACHKLYDEGGDVGPALTGSQRANLDYLLENVLDPSAVVPNDYRVVVIDMLDGRRINGIVRAETGKAVTVRTANETLVLPKAEIDSRQASKLSMMPEGLFDKLSDPEVKDLVAYLRSREQVPLPK